MSTLTIPPSALPAAELIRRTVPRPGQAPGRPFPARWFAPWKPPGTGFSGSAWCCPMGMLPDSPSPAPYHEFVDGLARSEVRAFAEWWDQQEDVEAAIGAVWGPA